MPCGDLDIILDMTGSYHPSTILYFYVVVDAEEANSTGTRAARCHSLDDDTFAELAVEEERLNAALE